MDPRIQTVIKLVEDDFGRDLALWQMAQLVNLSPPRLRHLCKGGDWYDTKSTFTCRPNATRQRTSGDNFSHREGGHGPGWLAR